MVKRSIKELYDTRMTWLVDLDYFFRVMENSRFHYISDIIMISSHNESQVTNSCFRKREIEIPEALMCFDKFGLKLAHCMDQYDGWWRFVRNLDIRQESDLTEHSKNFKIPQFLFDIIKAQAAIPPVLLRNRIISRLAMTLNYFLKFKPAI